MKRMTTTERPHWKESAENLGFKFHTIDGEPYWDESAYYQFTLEQIENDIEAPTQEIHQMCMDMVDRVAKSEHLMTQLSIPAEFHDFISTSWKEGHPHLYGRMDFSYHPGSPAKLLELNYDTPTSIYEAAAFQWLWLEEKIRTGELSGGSDQFNSIDSALREAFYQMKATNNFDLPFYFSSTNHSEEDKGTVQYLMDIASQVGHEARFIGLEDIGLNENRKFVDGDDNNIPFLFKLHAWEHIFKEGFGMWVEKSDTLFIEPAWKSILSNKGILPMLWDAHKGHPNLLECFNDPDPGKKLPAGWVRKPYYSREGSNVEMVDQAGKRIFVDGPYTDSPYIIQKYAPVPKFGDNFTLIGSWVVGDKACGIGIREDDSLITKDSSRFVPHIILD